MGKSEGVVQASFYFNCNADPPDGNKMADTTPEGISVLDLVTGQVRTIAVGSKSPSARSRLTSIILSPLASRRIRAR